MGEHAVRSALEGESLRVFMGHLLRDLRAFGESVLQTDLLIELFKTLFRFALPFFKSLFII